MSYFVTYDLKQSHTEFKNALHRLGFYSCITMQDGSKKKLPNTAVINDGNDLTDIQNKFQQAINSIIPNPGLEKVAYIPFAGAFTLNSNANC